MQHLLQDRKQIAEHVVRAAIAPEGAIARSYSPGRSQQDMRLALMLSLAEEIPIGRRFEDRNDLALWVVERLEAHPRGMSPVLRDRAAMVIDILWSALELVGGAEHVEDHGGFLLDIAAKAHRAYYRQDKALRAPVQAVAV